MPRPYKVWNVDRTVKKALVANSLEDLIVKAKQKLDISPVENTLLVLEEDGTEVEDEEYFKCLPDNTVFILLKEGKTWLSRKKTDGHDVPDFAVAMPDGDTVDADRLREITKCLRDDMSSIAAFPADDLQVLVNTDTNLLSKLLYKDENFAEKFKETCQQYLDNRSDAREAMELLKLYHKAEESTNSGKRQKIS